MLFYLFIQFYMYICLLFHTIFYNMNELQLIMNDIAEWSAKIFKHETSIQKLNHLTKEVDELKTAIFHEHGKYDINMEFADCFILLLGAASLQGLTAYNIINIIECKMAINKNRIWGEPDGNGVVEHVK
jgi:hypothetical protein